MLLKGKKALIVAGPDFEDRELFYPYYRLLEEGVEVKIAGIGDRQYKGKYGVPIEVDGQCEEFTGEVFDAVIIPGGWAPDKIRANEAALEIVADTFKKGGVVSAICHGPWVLASAEILNGRKVTSYKNIRHDLIHAGAAWSDAEVVVDGNLITSRTPADLPAFMTAIVKQMQLTRV